GDCGSSLPDAAKFCLNCGKQVGIAIAQPSGAAAAAATEKIILELGSVIVTDKRFVVPGQTFAVSQITSVSTGSKTSIAAGHAFGAMLLIIGAIFAIGGIALSSSQSDQTAFGVLGGLAVLGGIIA